MKPTVAVHRLTVELITRSLDHLSLGQLVRISHVCSRWRALALDHPIYWKKIIVDSVSQPALDLALHRINSSGSRTIDFTIDYREQHDQVPKRIIPLLRIALPRTRELHVKVESLYRFEVEEALCWVAPQMEYFQLLYASGPDPELPLTLPFGKGKNLFSGSAEHLRSVVLHNIILPPQPIAAFLLVDEVFFLHKLVTHYPEFPCYLFEFFPNVTRLRLSGGFMFFENAPLPTEIVQKMRQLTSFDITFYVDSLAGFFRHLPMNDIPELSITSPDEDSIYLALDPLRSPFRLSFTYNMLNEFFITVECGQSNFVRRFCEPFKYFAPGSERSNLLLENDEFAAQLASVRMQTSLWAMLNPWMPSLAALPKLIVEINESELHVALPSQPLACQHLTTLVIQTALAHDFVYIGADDLLAFADRITAAPVALELWRVLLRGALSQIKDRFDSIAFFDVRI